MNDSTAPPPFRCIDAIDSKSEQLSALERRDTDPCPPPDDGDRPTVPPSADLVDDPRMLAFLATYEAGLDARFVAMQDAVVERVAALLEARLEPIEGAMRLQSRLLERWAEDAVHAVTRVDQLTERADQVDARCTINHHSNGVTHASE